jgi:hypothetical protein
MVLTLASSMCCAQTPTAPTAQIQTKMVCSAYTGNPTKLPAFQIEVPFSLTDGVLAAEHTGTTGRREVFRGVIAASGESSS